MEKSININDKRVLCFCGLAVEISQGFCVLGKGAQISQGTPQVLKSTWSGNGKDPCEEWGEFREAEN